MFFLGDRNLKLTTMKVTKSLWAIALLLLFSCSDEPSTTSSEVQLQFVSQLDEEILPFPSTRGMPPIDIPDPEVKAESSDDKEIAELCSKIEYLVYTADNTTTPFRQKSYTEGMDDDFGIIYDKLPAGSYKIVFIAHSSKKASAQNGIMSFEDGISDTFYKIIEISISGNNPVNEFVTLKRVISRIEFASTEAVPADMKSLTIEITDFPNQLDLSSGHGLFSGNPFKIVHTFTPEELGKENMIHAFYCFDPIDNETISTQLKAVNTKDENTRTHQLSIDPIANKVIRYSGFLYSSPIDDNTFTLSINDNGKWSETIHKEL